MTNTKTLKRALLVSALTILMCVTMLIGTTFAWFTDSVTSSNNIIKSGNLDVEMHWANGKEAVPTDDSADWKDASTNAIFNYDKWEPGYIEAKHIKIANKGSLAFKYELHIVPNGVVDILADVIDVYFIEGATPVTRDTLGTVTPVGTLRDMINDTDGAVHGALLPEGETANTSYERVGKATATIAFKMRENASNDYQGKSIGTDFAVQLIATQYTFEADSFDNSYDVDAEYPTVVTNTADFKDAFANGGDITLAGTVNLGGGTGATLIPATDTTIEGGTIKGVGYDGEMNVGVKAKENNIVFDGVTFDLDNDDIKSGSWGMSVNVSGTANVTFKNCTFKGTQCPIYQSGADSVIVLENCKFETTSVAIQSEVYSGDFQLGQDLIIKNCDFTGVADVLHIYDHDKDPSSAAINQYLTANGNVFTGTCKQTCQ